MNEGLHGAYKKEFIDKTYADEPYTQKSLREDATKTLDLANRYVEEIRANNDRITEIAQTNWAYVDPDDIEIFLRFVEDWARNKVEVDPKGHIQTPFWIQEHMGPIAITRPEFSKRIREKFNEKVHRLSVLRRSWFGLLRSIRAIRSGEGLVH